jgi:two-component system, sporulation sensor kinase B
VILLDGIQDLLLNTLLILIPIFVYQTFWLERCDTYVPQRNSRAIGLLSTVAVLFCMTFPVYIAPGFVYDLRLIPLLVCVLYASRTSLLWCLLFLTVYRFMLGGIGFWIMAATYPVAIVLAYALLGTFRRSSARQKLLWAAALSIVASALVNAGVLAASDQPLTQNDYLPFFLSFVLLHGACMWLVVYLIENMREKVKMSVEIQRTEKLHVLGELAASLAHEVRNPMTVVRGFLQLLQDARVSPEKQLEYLEMSISELDRSEGIITNYLAFARPQIQRSECVDVGERLTRIAGIISAYAHLRNVEIQQRADEAMYVMLDPEKLSQALINVMKNGIEAMKEGGVLHIFASRHKKHVVIEVIDTGVGMTKEETARLGDPFYSTKEKGTGLGFMVAYQLIQSMNGKIEINSEKGRGTIFRISLPAVPCPPGQDSA